ncbi:MAG: hypothetical protein ACLTC8_14615 [Lachnospiraceae bacterium]
MENIRSTPLFYKCESKSGSRFTGWLLQAEHRLVTSEGEVTKNSCLKNGEIREKGGRGCLKL